MPVLHHASEGERGEGEGQQHHRALEADEQAALVHTVHDDAREQREQHHRQGGEERDCAEFEGRAGEPVDEPLLRGGLHPRAGEGDELAEPVQAVVAMAQGAQRGGQMPFPPAEAQERGDLRQRVAHNVPARATHPLRESASHVKAAFRYAWCISNSLSVKFST